MALARLLEGRRLSDGEDRTYERKTVFPLGGFDVVAQPVRACRRPPKIGEGRAPMSKREGSMQLLLERNHSKR